MFPTFQQFEQQFFQGIIHYTAQIHNDVTVIVIQNKNN